jgi:hydrogenase maturation protease
MGSVHVRGSAPGGAAGRTLVAGVGNIFLGDDGFGVETVGRLAGRLAGRLPEGVDLMDAGIRGVHLAYRLLDGYRRLILVDAVDRGAPPGSVQVIDIDPAEAGPVSAEGLDGHRMDPAAVLRMVKGLQAQAGGTLPEEILLVGCQPLTTAEGIGLSEPVSAATGPAAELVLELVRCPPARPAAGPSGEDPSERGAEGCEHDVGVDLRGTRGGGGGLRDGEVRTGRTPLPADAADVRKAAG